jgi:hypothetical protein
VSALECGSWGIVVEFKVEIVGSWNKRVIRGPAKSRVKQIEILEKTVLL